MTEDKNYFEKEVFSSNNYKFTFHYDKALLDQILKYKKNGKVLDLGCGEGGLILELAEKGFDVTCLDISKTAINAIKDEAKKRKINIKAFCFNLENYKILENYDLIICMGVLHFINQEKAIEIIKDIQKHTKKGGLNVLDVLTGENFFMQGQIKEIYSNESIWNILDFEKYKETFGVMNYLFAKKRVVS
jgi:tellurite methyltransferase